MKKTSLTIFIFITMFITSCENSANINFTNDVSLNIEKVALEDGKLYVNLQLNNISENQINLWSFDTSPGISSISFYFVDPCGARIPIVRRSTTDVTGVSFSTISLDAKHTYNLSFDIMDGSWILPEFVGAGDATVLIAELNLPSGNQRAGIWSGRAVSADYKVNVAIFQILPYAAAPHRE